MTKDTAPTSTKNFDAGRAKKGDRIPADIVASPAFDRAATAETLKAIDLKLEDDLDAPGGLIVTHVAI
jgi:hypothetical protein